MEIILGQRLKELRAEKKLTQKEVAEYLRISSVTYLRYEKAPKGAVLRTFGGTCGFFRSVHGLSIGLERILKYRRGESSFLPDISLKPPK